MEKCVSNDFDEKIDEITKHFTEEIRKIKTELQSAKETIQLNTVHFNGEINKVKTELKRAKETLQSKSDHFDEELKQVKTELESSKTNLDQLQRENARLKENLENASKNRDNIMSKIETLAQSSSKEPIYFDYSLESSMTFTGTFEIVKFDRPMAVSATKIYDRSTGKVTIEEDGLYYFYVHGLPLEKSDWFNLIIYVDDQIACAAGKEDGTRAHMSCAIVRHFKRGQTIHVQKVNKLYGGSLSTGFLGFKIQ